MAEFARLLNCFLQSLPVFHVAGVVANAAVENVLQGILSQELVTKDPHASRVLKLHP